VTAAEIHTGGELADDVYDQLASILIRVTEREVEAEPELAAGDP
jgi:hypothetical protein